MKVRELIETLQKLDPELIVCVTDACEWTGPVGTIEVRNTGTYQFDGVPVGVDYVYITTGDVH